MRWLDPRAARTRCGVSGAALLLLSGCDAPTVDVAANVTDNVVLPSNELHVPQAELAPIRARARDRVSGSPDQEPRMPPPDPETTPPPPRTDPAVTPPLPARPPAAPPRRVVVPAPTQPPAEIDPVHRDPGDKVPL